MSKPPPLPWEREPATRPKDSRDRTQTGCLVPAYVVIALSLLLCVAIGREEWSGRTRNSAPRATTPAPVAEAPNLEPSRTRDRSFPRTVEASEHPDEFVAVSAEEIVEIRAHRECNSTNYCTALIWTGADEPYLRISFHRRLGNEQIGRIVMGVIYAVCGTDAATSRCSVPWLHNAVATEDEMGARSARFFLGDSARRPTWFVAPGYHFPELRRDGRPEPLPPIVWIDGQCHIFGFAIDDCGSRRRPIGDMIESHLYY